MDQQQQIDHFHCYIGVFIQHHAEHPLLNAHTHTHKDGQWPADKQSLKTRSKKEVLTHMRIHKKLLVRQQTWHGDLSAAAHVAEEGSLCIWKELINDQ